MANDKSPVQADGQGSRSAGNPPSGSRGAGESGGGAYPNPHSGKSPRSTFLGHGGQTEVQQKAPGKKLGDLGKA